MTYENDWRVMNDLQEAFNQIGSIEFLLEQLQESVDSEDKMGIINTSHALNSFIPVYTENWESKFKVAWGEIINGDSN